MGFNDEVVPVRMSSRTSPYNFTDLDCEYPIFLSRAQTFSQDAELECMGLSYVQADKKAVIGVSVLLLPLEYQHQRSRKRNPQRHPNLTDPVLPRNT